MQVSVTCRHGSIRPELREYIERKSEKLVRYLGQVSEIDVTLEFEGPRVTVEMLVEIDGYHTIVAHVEGEDAGAAFDKTLHKMEQQVHRYKEKKNDHRRDVPVSEVTAGEVSDGDAADTEAGQN
ncbi:MAG: ribosome-associated translation inhibitor RaiA [Planctomycetaceae bacterium]|nr:ribosome-associated translation inhibitor RaiA [Planctomycetaceae bacterium]